MALLRGWPQQAPTSLRNRHLINVAPLQWGDEIPIELFWRPLRGFSEGQEFSSENSCLFVSIRGYAVFGVFWNEGSDSSMTTHGILSSRKIAFCGANGVGSSSDAIVTSMVSESSASSKNR